MNEHAPVIETAQLTKRYGDQQILDGIDLKIAPGETYALLGPNGAGKSTTIEMLEGTRRPTSGTISVLGETPLSAGRAWKNRIGIVAQETGELGPYTPDELLTQYAGMYANPRGTDEVLELVGLTSKRKTRANKLSGGQQRRLDVALGIIGRPELLFLDEPTTGFDPEARRSFWRMLEGLTHEGTAILLTTHYLDEAAHLADRVGVLTNGRIVAEAPPALLGGERTPVVSWIDANGKRQRVETNTPAQFVADLVANHASAPPPAHSDTEQASRAHTAVEPRNLEVTRPSLEDVYLEMIGESVETDPASTPEGVAA